MNYLNIKRSRLGRRVITREGMTCEVIKYVNSKNVKVRILETGETQWTDFSAFEKGRVFADFATFPYNGGDCTFKQAKFFTIAIAALLLSSIGAAIYNILS